MISTQVKNRVICFFDGTAQFITEEQESATFSPQATQRGGLQIDGNWLNLKAISRIISAEDYYKAFPEKRPAKVLENWMEQPKFDWKKENRKSAIESMIRGMEKYLASTKENPLLLNGMKVFYQGTEAPKELLQAFQSKLKEVTK